jgi:hypothetical protein
MNTKRLIVPALLVGGSLIVAGCGGSSPPAETPASEAPAASNAPAAASASSATAEAPAPPGSAAPAPAAAVAPAPSSKRTARDVLELKDTVFFLAFDESDPKKGAESSCSKASGKNAKKMSACMSKARDQVDEGYRFEQDKDGTMWWLVVRRKGNALVTVHRMRFTYGTESDTSVSIKPEGKDLGTKPWRKGAPAEVKFDVPNDYRIVVRDPEHGKMVYEAKSGIASK